MNQNNKQLKTVVLPQRLFNSMIEAYQKWERLSDELEDFLLSENKQFLQKIRKARKEHLAGKARDLKVFKQELK